MFLFTMDMNEFFKNEPFYGSIVISVLATLQYSLINALSSGIVTPLIGKTKKELENTETKIFGKNLLLGKIILVIIEILVVLLVLHLTFVILNKYNKYRKF
jgi:large-conductance mechanosensitive channel